MIIEQVQYEIYWSEFKRGSSFFVPCLDTVQAKRTILEVTKRLKYKVLLPLLRNSGVLLDE